MFIMFRNQNACTRYFDISFIKKKNTCNILLILPRYDTLLSDILISNTGPSGHEDQSFKPYKVKHSLFILNKLVDIV